VEITRHTKVADLLDAYGDLAPVMEMFGVKRIGGSSLRRLLAKGLTVEWAARIHRVPLDDFLELLHKAVADSTPPT
jgi:hypothetical protein